MKTTVLPISDSYRGLASTNREPCVVLGLETIESGMLWWKKVVYNDVWCVCTTYIHHDFMSSDYFWQVVRYFPYNEKEAALKFLNDLNTTAS